MATYHQLYLFTSTSPFHSKVASFLNPHSLTFANISRHCNAVSSKPQMKKYPDIYSFIFGTESRNQANVHSVAPTVIIGRALLPAKSKI